MANAEDAKKALFNQLQGSAGTEDQQEVDETAENDDIEDQAAYSGEQNDEDAGSYEDADDGEGEETASVDEQTEDENGGDYISIAPDQLQALQTGLNNVQQKEAELDKAIAEQRAWLETEIGEEPKPPSEDLLDEDHPDYDPQRYKSQHDGYKRSKERWDRKRDRYNEIKRGDVEKLGAQREQFNQQRVAYLQERWPEIVNEKTADAVQRQLHNFVQGAYGINADEALRMLEGVPGPSLMIMKDAMAYRKAKTPAKPKVTSQRAGNRKPPVAKQSSPKEAGDRYKKSRSAKDARAALGLN